VIAIDGPAGAGKSTVAKRVADILNIQYLDTGAMYRAFTYVVLQRGIDLNDLDTISSLLEGFDIVFRGQRVFVGDSDVTRDIRSDAVTDTVSYISSLAIVRKKMVELQREMGENSSVVAEGRDIGTVVFPDTKHKFYLDASIEKRAQRRIGDSQDQSHITDINIVKSKLEQRDRYDSTRDISPLTKAPDAHYLDTTHMTIEEVSNYIITQVNEQ
jgi:cytidylate kinase